MSLDASRTLRILIFTSTYAPRVGGVETVVRHLARGLVERGHTVTIATNKYPRRLLPFEVVDGVPVHRQLYPSLPRLASGKGFERQVAQLPLLFLAPIALIRLWLLVRRVRPDVVNVHYLSYPARYMLAVSRLLGIRTVLSFHGSDLSNVPYPTNSHRAVRRACKGATVVTACSRHLAERLTDLIPDGGRRVVVAPNGVSKFDVAAGNPEDGNLLIVARLVAKKGVDVALLALAELKRRGIFERLVVAGDGPERGRLQALADALGVRESVTFLGNVGTSRVAELISESKAVLVPSRWEAFGTICLEAMMAGRPVIASESGGITEVVRDSETGVLIPPGDAEALATAIADLRADPVKYSEMGRRGRQQVLTGFSWEQTVDAYLAAYSLALSPAATQAVVAS